METPDFKERDRKDVEREKKAGREEEEYKEENLNLKRNNYTSNAAINISNGRQDEEEEYMMKKQFYEKMLNDDYEDEPKEEKKISSLKKVSLINSNFQNNFNSNQGNISISKNNPKSSLHIDHEIDESCAACQSATLIDSKARLRKKENPALLEPNEIRYDFKK